MTSHPQRTKRAPVPHPRKAKRKVAAPPQERTDGPQGIAKLLARAGIASRREIERMIAEGRIALNGEKITTPATLLSDVTGLTVDGRPVRPAKATRLYRFYKPPRALTAAHDSKGRPTIYDKLPKGLPRLMPVGRLDFLTEGKNREVRRVLEHLGLQVSRLIRTAYGPLTLEGLEPGAVDEVDRELLEQFRKTLK
jgi:23S rRNA pseudouridine2605 synthase